MAENISIFKCGEIEVSISIDGDWHINETGVYKLIKPDKKIFICSPVWIDSKIVDVNTGYVKVKIKGFNLVSQKVFWFITEMANLLTSMQNQLPKILANCGVYISQGENSKVLEYLARQPAPTVYGIDKLGWHQDEEHQLFVLPEQIIGGQDGKEYCYTPDSYAPSQKAITTSGTLESWQQLVVSVCEGNPVPLFALGIAFAAPLMQLLNVDGGGFHFWGHSSRGKTTILQVSASVYGNASDPAVTPDGSLIQRWNTTANALEGTALAYNDLLLPMDELGTSNIKNFGQVVYQLAGGKGKAAMNANRDMRTPRTWRTQIMSTGEHAIAQEILATTGAEARTGQLIRMLDICVEGNIFPAISSGEAAGKVIALKNACSQNYGVAAMPYLQHLVQVANSPIKGEWLQCFELVEEALIDSCPDIQPEQQRAIKRFALVAVGLMLATEAGCIAVKDEVIMDSVWHVLKMWLNDSPTVSEADRGIDMLKQTIQMNPGRFGNATPQAVLPTGGNNLLGYRHDVLMLYLIPVKCMAEVCGRPNHRGVIAKLDELGMLLKNNTDANGNYRQTYKLKLPNGQNVSGYAISYNLFKDDIEVKVA
ncbi:DUF927 domain-containing protein [Agitococcus lubricus]|uniref:Uncharacterized protein DUF927 n=1 Tax=Agitococcus lubricus TaxID=1077255 RepID=A0A2T5ISG2_9GAMM|nr:DUF927 domain-containing protein [Agitococcus lubricus]PTQ86786.1 uncharacterized protein DUF927 [Agitococcus lubricus]